MSSSNTTEVTIRRIGQGTVYGVLILLGLFSYSLLIASFIWARRCKTRCQNDMRSVELLFYQLAVADTTYLFGLLLMVPTVIKGEKFDGDWKYFYTVSSIVDTFSFFAAFFLVFCIALDRLFMLGVPFGAQRWRKLQRFLIFSPWLIAVAMVLWMNIGKTCGNEFNTTINHYVYCCNNWHDEACMAKDGHARRHSFMLFIKFMEPMVILFMVFIYALLFYKVHTSNRQFGRRMQRAGGGCVGRQPPPPVISERTLQSVSGVGGLNGDADKRQSCIAIQRRFSLQDYPQSQRRTSSDDELLDDIRRLSVDTLLNSHHRQTTAATRSAMKIRSSTLQQQAQQRSSSILRSWTIQTPVDYRVRYSKTPANRRVSIQPIPEQQPSVDSAVPPSPPVPKSNTSAFHRIRESLTPAHSSTILRTATTHSHLQLRSAQERRILGQAFIICSVLAVNVLMYLFEPDFFDGVPVALLNIINGSINSIVLFTFSSKVRKNVRDMLRHR